MRTRRAVHASLEMVCEKGSAEVVAHDEICGEKDTRRAGIIVVVFCAAQV